MTADDLSELILRESPDAVIVLATDGSVTYWGNAAETIFGYPAGKR
ncbi:MAG: PAS domain S-box protein [Azoarcus sp. PHD]|nr:MAG: PAS domain S-box protein [Azoarcus sp. PHD]